MSHNVLFKSLILGVLRVKLQSALIGGKTHFYCPMCEAFTQPPNKELERSWLSGGRAGFPHLMNCPYTTAIAIQYEEEQVHDGAGH